MAVARMVVALEPVDLHLQEDQSLIINKKFNYKSLHHIKILDHHTLVVYNGVKEALLNQSLQNILLIKQLTNQKKIKMQTSSVSLLPEVRKEWTKIVMTNQSLPNSKNSQKHLLLIYLTWEVQTQNLQPQDSVIY